jgi:hypothetical protein
MLGDGPSRGEENENFKSEGLSYLCQTIDEASFQIPISTFPSVALCACDCRLRVGFVSLQDPVLEQCYW